MVFVLGELDDGVMYWAPAPAEITSDDLQIGDRVRLGLRCFTNRDGIAVYGMKFIPDAAPAPKAASSAVADTNKSRG